MSDHWQFTKGAHTVSLPPPDEFETWEEKSQALDWTAAGEPRAYDKDVTRRMARLTWRGLPSAAKQALTAFFHNGPADAPEGVNGVMESFALADHEANAYAARFLRPELRFATDPLANRWRVSVDLVLSDVIAT